MTKQKIIKWVDIFNVYFKKKSISKKVLFTVIMVAVMASVIFLSVYYLNADSDIDNRRKELARIEEKETTMLVDKIARHTVVPAGKPNISTVGDANELKTTNSFFEEVKNGDKVLFFPDRAMIYRPSEDRVVKVGPITSGGNGAENSKEEVIKEEKSEEQEEDVKLEEKEENEEEEEEESIEVEEIVEQELSFEVRNGAGIAGIASATSKQIGVHENYTVESIGNAVSSGHIETIMIKNTEKDVSSVEDFFGLVATPIFPEGEADSDADIIIIIGSDNHVLESISQ